MGPFELLDQVGIDVAAHIAKTVHGLSDNGWALSAAEGIIQTFEQMCKKGWLGQKSGLGFYRYEGKKKKFHAEAVAVLPAEPDAPTQPAPDHANVVEARDRMVLLMVNEAAACLQEGLGERADVIDLAMVLGTGWAPHRGGPLRYADDRGVADVVKTLEELTRRHGVRFEPFGELRQRVATKELFYSTLPAPAIRCSTLPLTFTEWLTSLAKWSPQDPLTIYLLPCPQSACHPGRARTHPLYDIIDMLATPRGRVNEHLTRRRSSSLGAAQPG